MDQLGRSAPRADNTRPCIPVPEMHTSPAPRELHILVASADCINPSILNLLLPQIADLPDVSARAILDRRFCAHDFVNGFCLTMPNVSKEDTRTGEDARYVEREAAELCEWADLLVLAPMDANNLGKMLHGNTDSLMLEVLRSWNVSKKILMLPGMSALMWENPMTRKQLNKVRRKWNWVTVLQPILWTFESEWKKFTSWEGIVNLMEAIRNQVDLMNIGQDMEVSPSHRATFSTSESHSTDRQARLLPPELWSMIVDFTGDWELAQTLGFYTNLPTPQEWQKHTLPHGPQTYMEKLEWTILTGNYRDLDSFIVANSVPRWLSRLCIKLIMRFAMTTTLSYLENTHRDLFWATFGHTFLPDKASSVFGRPEILEFWRTSPSFLTKEYTAEALDGASRAGFVQVLDWWRTSGLPLRYTEAALEQASSQGHVDVLEWWAGASKRAGGTQEESDAAAPVRLKPGKAICYATQAGQTAVVRWWIESGVGFLHEDTVAKLASTHGHVPILALWLAFKGSKMIFDNQVLIGATRFGHVDVLEWWRRSGLRVEYKTCDVEEALEDGAEGKKGAEVRRWWAKNGLNLGVGTSEWMRTKVLN
ncbi:hypothetical protein LTR66_008698 [Elasticomyces elasticus]|nr:hypothetical protein LTR66_008698 [Elasticomyces elasticus]